MVSAEDIEVTLKDYGSSWAIAMEDDIYLILLLVAWDLDENASAPQINNVSFCCQDNHHPFEPKDHFG